jgi:hypothetical protein
VTNELWKHVSFASEFCAHTVAVVRLGIDIGNLTFGLLVTEARHVVKFSLQPLIAQMHNVIELAVSYGLILHVPIPTSETSKTFVQGRVMINCRNIFVNHIPSQKVNVCGLSVE